MYIVFLFILLLESSKMEMYSNTNQGERVMPVLVVQGGGQEGHGGTQGRLSEYFITLLLITT